MPDVVRGWRLRPGFAGWTAGENTLWIRINSDGLRDREHARAKPPRTVRVAILGDSYMQAINVPFESTFAALLERELSTCARSGGRSIEVLNFGVSGYGTVQEWLTYRDHASAYSPDIVLIAFYSGNDVHDNSPVFNQSAAPFLQWNGRDWQLDNAFIERLDRPTWRTSLRAAITSRSRTAMLVHRAYSSLRHAQEFAPESADDSKWNEDLDASRPPDDDPEFIEAWRMTEAALMNIVSDARQRGAEPWIVTLATAAQVDPDLHRRRRAADAMGVDDLYYSERRIAAFGEAHNVGVVNLAPPLADHAARTHEFLNGGLSDQTPPGQGHWNPTGHRLAAQIAAARLCESSGTIAAHRRALGLERPSR